MATDAQAVDPALHRQLGVDLFNLTWTLLDKPDRTDDEDEAMIHAAHASRHHWAQVGEARHHARGEWQCSRVHAVLGQAEQALYHARRCLEWCGRGEVEDWDVAFAHEALARAHAAAGAWDEAGRAEARARELGAAIADPEDRELLESDLATLPRRPS